MASSGKNGGGTRPHVSKAFKPTAADVKTAPQRVSTILKLLKKAHPDAACELVHQDALQLLIATILSAQCTDQRVNLVTPGLFKKYPNAQAFAQADPAELEDAIKSTGFYRNKAKNIQVACRAIVEKHAGKVPRELDELTALAGVGRKTANVVRGNAYGLPAVVTDTHVLRLSRLLGLTRQTDPEKVEADLMVLFPSQDWTLLGHLLIFHGRRVCMASRPQCLQCSLRSCCVYALKNSTKLDAPGKSPSGAKKHRF